MSRRNCWGLVPSIALLAVSTVGCGDGEIGMDGACAAIVAAVCDVGARCGELPGDPTICRQTSYVRNTEAECRKNVSLVKAGRATYHGDVVTRCITQSKSASCNDIAELLSCANTFFSGPLGEGQTCRATAEPECAFGLTCVGSGGGSASCTRLASEGEPCSMFESCADDLVCHPDNHVCVARAGYGRPCDKIYCEFELTCDSTKHCVPRPKVGEPCTVGWFGSDCDTGLYCGPTGRCVVRSDHGESCVTGAECRYGLTCHPLPGTCQLSSAE